MLKLNPLLLSRLALPCSALFGLGLALLPYCPADVVAYKERNIAEFSQKIFVPFHGMVGNVVWWPSIYGTFFFPLDSITDYLFYSVTLGFAPGTMY